MDIYGVGYNRMNMERQPFENTKRLFERIKNIGFWARVFMWREIISLAMDALVEFREIDEKPAKLSATIQTLKSEIQDLKSDLKHEQANSKKLDTQIAEYKVNLQHYNEMIKSNEKEIGQLKESDKKNESRKKELEKDLEVLHDRYDQNIEKIKSNEKEIGQLRESDRKNAGRKNELEKELAILKSNFDENSKTCSEHEKELAKIRKVEQTKQEEYEHKVTELNSVIDRLDAEKKRLQEEREEEIKNKHERMKATWKIHESSVEQSIRAICKRHAIEYLSKEKVPFSGKPDNTIMIANEYIIFDAKSPVNDSFSNFPGYIKAQAEAAKKYAEEKDVKKDIFLVVPTNTIELFKETYINCTKYSVHIITADSLEPIILSLQRIEEYEFAENLSPEERDNICRLIGRFAHTTKRRIQIDQYFTDEFIDILSRANSLPEEILNKVQDYEKSGKLNPPQDKRIKTIGITTLEKTRQRLAKEAEAKNINMHSKMEKIEEIPLSKE